jgi:hypothetical protein
MRFISILFILTLVNNAFGQIKLLFVHQVAYDSSPRIILKGTGFDSINVDDILLELGVTEQPMLVKDQDYSIIKDSDVEGLILKLQPGKK